MVIQHVALYNESLEKSDAFYGTLLGMQKVTRFPLPEKLSLSIFGRSSRYDVVQYGKDSVLFEIFIGSTREACRNLVSHTCIAVEKRTEVIQKAKQMGFEVTIIPREGSDLMFIRDSAGNIFEVKEAV
jgi:catechol 2,3-dioxygenase-like lactoylglutathione lyase family enzyme